MNFWKVLQLTPTNNIDEIETAYNRLLAQCLPKEHPAEFEKLQRAYQSALEYAKQQPVNTASFSLHAIQPKNWDHITGGANKWDHILHRKIPSWDSIFDSESDAETENQDTYKSNYTPEPPAESPAFFPSHNKFSDDLKILKDNTPKTDTYNKTTSAAKSQQETIREFLDDIRTHIINQSGNHRLVALFIEPNYAALKDDPIFLRKLAYLLQLQHKGVTGNQIDFFKSTYPKAFVNPVNQKYLQPTLAALQAYNTQGGNFFEYLLSNKSSETIALYKTFIRDYYERNDTLSENCRNILQQFDQMQNREERELTNLIYSINFNQYREDPAFISAIADILNTWKNTGYTMPHTVAQALKDTFGLNTSGSFRRYENLQLNDTIVKLTAQNSYSSSNTARPQKKRKKMKPSNLFLIVGIVIFFGISLFNDTAEEKQNHSVSEICSIREDKWDTYEEEVEEYLKQKTKKTYTVILLYSEFTDYSLGNTMEVNCYDEKYKLSAIVTLTVDDYQDIEEITYRAPTKIDLEYDEESSGYSNGITSKRNYLSDTYEEEIEEYLENETGKEDNFYIPYGSFDAYAYKNTVSFYDTDYYIDNEEIIVTITLDKHQRIQKITYKKIPEPAI